MKKAILILWLAIFASCVIQAEAYKHKTEAELARMTPAQRVDEYADEQAYHKYDVLDKQWMLIHRYIMRDGLAALPRMIEIIDEYDPTRPSGKRGHKGERFDAMWMLLDDLDNHVIRVMSDRRRSACDGRARTRYQTDARGGLWAAGSTRLGAERSF